MENITELKVLSSEDAMNIFGGDTGPTKETSFAYDVAYFFGATIRCIWEFSSGAMEYQQSLPANLKK
ncbi:MAG: hypothetical protein JNJ75_00515 [Cyclobacteriaceae bacterium]|nr:hypothetical protein [Cyclobacteriaceae bacterium]